MKQQIKVRLWKLKSNTVRVQYCSQTTMPSQSNHTIAWIQDMFVISDSSDIKDQIIYEYIEHKLMHMHVCRYYAFYIY